MAITEFTNSILAGIEIRPIALGKGNQEKVAAILQTFRWKDGYDIRSPTHPYHAVWVPFETWCHENGLVPEIGACTDVATKEPLKTITVRAAAIGATP